MAEFYSKDGRKRCFVEEKVPENYINPFTNSRRSETKYEYERNNKDERFLESADSFKTQCSAPSSTNEYSYIVPSSSNENSYLAPSGGNVNSYLAPSGGNVNSNLASSGGNVNSYLAPSGRDVNSYLAPSGGDVNSYLAPSGGNVNSYLAPSAGNVNSYLVPSGGDVNSYLAPSGGDVNSYLTPSGGNVNLYLAPSGGDVNSYLAPSCGNVNSYLAPSGGDVNSYLAPSGSSVNSYLVSFDNRGLVQYPINVKHYTKESENKSSVNPRVEHGAGHSRKDNQPVRRTTTRSTREFRHRETRDQIRRSRNRHRDRNSCSSFGHRYDRRRHPEKRLFERKYFDETVGSHSDERKNKTSWMKSPDSDFEKVSSKGLGRCYGSPSNLNQSQGQSFNLSGHLPIEEGGSSNINSSSLSPEENILSQCHKTADQIETSEIDKDYDGMNIETECPRTLESKNHNVSCQSESNNTSAFALLLEKQKQFLEKSKCFEKSSQSENTSGQNYPDNCMNNDSTTASGPRQCSLCLKYFQTQKLLTEHLWNFHPIPNGSISKNGPKMTSNRSRNMACFSKGKHKEDIDMEKVSKDDVFSDMPHVSDDPNIRYVLTCLVCERQTLHNLKLAEDHFQTTHSEYNELDNVYNCLVCDKKFYKVEQFRTHMLDYHAFYVPQHPDGTILKMPLTCKICRVSCKRLRALRKHMYRDHIKSVLKCPICGYRTILTRNMNHHMIKFHTMEKPFQCSMCNLSFDLELELNEHELSHKLKQNLDNNDKKISECEFCGEIIPNKRKWINHMKRKHEIVDIRKLKDYSKFFT